MPADDINLLNSTPVLDDTKNNVPDAAKNMAGENKTKITESNEPAVIPTPMEEINITPPVSTSKPPSMPKPTPDFVPKPEPTQPEVTPLKAITPENVGAYTSPPPYNPPDLSTTANTGAPIPVNEPKSFMPFGNSINTQRIKNFTVNFIVPIVCLSVSVLLFMLVIYPSITNIPKMDSDIRNKNRLKDTLTQKLSTLNRLLDFKSVVTENSDLVNKVMTSEGMVPELLNQVDVIAKASGLEVTRLSYSLAQGGTGALGYSAVDVALGARGNYGQIITFLSSVEDAARLVNIASLRFSAGTKDTETLNFNIVLRSPFLYVNSEAVTDDMVDLDISSTQFTEFINKLKSLRYYDPKELPAAQIPETPPEEATEETATPEGEATPLTETVAPIEQPTT